MSIWGQEFLSLYRHVTDSIYIHAEDFLNYLNPQFTSLEEVDKENLLEKVALTYQDLITEYYDELAKDVFNIQNNNHCLEMKTEAVISSAYFRATRRYSQWIKKKEGIPTDELDIKGLEFKKTNFPKVFSKFVGSLLEQALKGESEDTIANQVLEYKEKILRGHFSIDEIGNPTAVRTLNNYLESPPQSGELFSKLKIRASAAVKASWRYNDLLRYWDLSKDGYPFISQGDKIKWVYLKNNPLQIETIAFMGGLTPPKILNFINEHIDYEQVFEKVLLNKLIGFFDDLGFRLKLNKYESMFFEI